MIIIKKAACEVDLNDGESTQIGVLLMSGARGR